MQNQSVMQSDDGDTTERLNLVISSSIANRLRAQAKLRNLSVQALLREFIAEKLDELDEKC